MSSFKPYRPDDDDDEDRGIAWFALSAFGPRMLLGAFWLPGYFILQYVFVWNRWKIIKFDGWATFITGVLLWVTVLIVLATHASFSEGTP